MWEGRVGKKEQKEKEGNRKEGCGQGRGVVKGDLESLCSIYTAQACTSICCIFICKWIHNVRVTLSYLKTHIKWHLCTW